MNYSIKVTHDDIGLIFIQMSLSPWTGMLSFLSVRKSWICEVIFFFYWLQIIVRHDLFSPSEKSCCFPQVDLWIQVPFLFSAVILLPILSCTALSHRPCRIKPRGKQVSMFLCLLSTDGWLFHCPLPNCRTFCMHSLFCIHMSCIMTYAGRLSHTSLIEKSK